MLRFASLTTSYSRKLVGCGEERQTGRFDEKHPCFSPLRALRVPTLSRRIGAGLLVSSLRLALRAVLRTFPFAPGERVHGARRVPDKDVRHEPRQSNRTG